MVVSGVPVPRVDHMEALACLALDMAAAVADVTDPQGRDVPLRIGLAAGPVVAGVVGARKFFYDVWATRSTSRRGWKPPMSRVEFRWHTTSTSASTTRSCCTSAAS